MCGGGGGSQTHTCIGSEQFVGFKNLNFNIFSYLKKEGSVWCEDYGYFLVITKI